MSRIELDIFSGRPNPGWDLNAAQRAELRRRLARLSPSMAKVTVPGLGYRGFIVRDDEELRIFHGHVLPGSDTDNARSAAADQEIERWLLETGKAVMDASLHDWVLQQIGND